MWGEKYYINNVTFVYIDIIPFFLIAYELVCIKITQVVAESTEHTPVFHKTIR